MSASDDWKYKQKRLRLVGELREKGITDERVLEAIAAVPRHLFIEPALRERAYLDEALPIGLSQTISQPFTVAYQTMLLAPSRNDRVLEIGAGSGYQAAVLCELGVRMFSVERHKPLLDRTGALLEQLGYRVLLRHGDGTQGWPTFAPYDRIIVTAGAAEAPRPLLEQLRAPEGELPGGCLVIPIGDESGQVMNRIRRTGPAEYEREQTHTFRFVPLIGEGGGGYS